MYFLSYFGCVQVVLIVSQLVYSSHSLPLDPSPRFDIGILIDPLNQANNDDLESKKVIAKSVFNTPLRTAPPAANRCPPGHQSLDDGSCVKTISGISLNEETLVSVLDNFYKNNKRRPPSRHRLRTTTLAPRLKVEDSVPTTTEVITERTVPFEPTTPQPSPLLMQQQVAAANPTIYPEPTPNPATTTLANEPGGYQISNLQHAPIEAQDHQNYELVPTTTTPTEYITEVSVPMEFIIYSTFEPQQSTPVQIFKDMPSPPNNPIILPTITNNHTSSLTEPDGNNHDNNVTNTTPMPSPLLHELQQINDELFPTTTTTATTPSSKLQEVITEVYASVSSLEEFETTTTQPIPQPSLSSDETSSLDLLSSVKDVAQSIPDLPITLPPSDIIISASSLSISSEESKNQQTVQENPSTPPPLFLPLTRQDETVVILQDREETKSQEEAKDEKARQSQLPSSETGGASRQERNSLESEVVLQEPKEDDKGPEKNKSTNLSSSLENVKTIIVPVSSTSESTIDSTSSSNAVIKEPF